MEPEILNIARQAYNAYGKSTDFKNYQGLPMPDFDSLPDSVKCAWVAACERVLELLSVNTRGTPTMHLDVGTKAVKTISGFPRRNRVDLFTPAESAILEAQQAIELTGCHPLLTESSMLLQQARDKVADYVEFGQEAG